MKKIKNKCVQLKRRAVEKACSRKGVQSKRRAVEKACSQKGVQSKRRALEKGCVIKGVHSKRRALQKACARKKLFYLLQYSIDSSQLLSAIHGFKHEPSEKHFKP